MTKKVSNKQAVKKGKTKGAIKRDAPKKVPPKKIKPEPSRSKSALSAAVTAKPVAPARAPLRKILGVNNSLTVVPAATATPLPEPPKVSLPKPPTPAPKIVAEIPKYSWDGLPQHLPAYVKFLIGMAKKECDNALNWPFPFAKFVAALPQEVCGMDFGLLLLNLEHDNAEIARITKLELDLVERAIARGASKMRECFVSICGEMDRKLRTQLAGRGMLVEALIEPYLVAKVDRNFQVAIGAILLKSMRSENGKVQQGTSSAVNYR